MDMDSTQNHDSSTSTLPPSPPPPPPANSSENGNSERYKLMLKHLLKSFNGYAVVLTIVLSISYVAYLQPPSVLFEGRSSSRSNCNCSNSEELPPSIWQTLFFCFNSVSFFSSVCALLLFAGTSFSPLLTLRGHLHQDSHKSVLMQVARILPKFVYMNIFLAVSLTFSVLAFFFAGLSIMGRHKTAICISSVLGMLVFAQVMLVSVRDMVSLWMDSIEPDSTLCQCLKEESVLATWLFKYIALWRTRRTPFSSV